MGRSYLEGEPSALHDRVARDVPFCGEVDAIVGSTAFFPREGGGNHDRCDGVEVAGFDGAAGQCVGHGPGEDVELGLGALKAGGVAEETGVAPHEGAEAGDPVFERLRVFEWGEVFGGCG